MSEDPFEDVFNLENGFYTQGYEQGVKDGEQAGRIEGRQFGMSTGYEKFLESGRLAGRATVWANRIPNKSQSEQSQPQGSDTATSATETKEHCTLPPLQANPRLEKNIRTLYALVEPDTLSTANSDEAVQDFDDRVKRAQGKAKVIERMAS